MNMFTRGQIIPLEGSAGPVRFQWNPEDIDGPTANADWVAIPTAGARIPAVEYNSGETPEIRFELMLSHTAPADDVDSMVKALQALTEPTVRGKGRDRAPRLKLILGARRWTCVLRSAVPRFGHWFHPITLKPYFAKIHLVFWVVQ